MVIPPPRDPPILKRRCREAMRSTADVERRWSDARPSATFTASLQDGWRRMEFRVLGPLEVRDDAGNVVPVPGARERRLLVVLLLEANEAVPLGRLIGALWAGKRPETAARLARRHLSRLSGLLDAGAERGAPGRLVVSSGGYRLRVGRGELDLHRFEALVGEARARTDTAASLALRRMAQELWRSPPLEEFAHEGFARAEIARLEELRLASIEERIDLGAPAGPSRGSHRRAQGADGGASAAGGAARTAHARSPPGGARGRRRCWSIGTWPVSSPGSSGSSRGRRSGRSSGRSRFGRRRPSVRCRGRTTRSRRRRPNSGGRVATSERPSPSCSPTSSTPRNSASRSTPRRCGRC